jgi:hypothetical protein
MRDVAHGIENRPFSRISQKVKNTKTPLFSHRNDNSAPQYNSLKYLHNFGEEARLVNKFILKQE